MAVEASLVIDTANNQNGSVTQFLSPGFGTPDVVLFWCTDLSPDGTITDSYNHSFGWATPSATRCIGTYSSFNNSLSSTTRHTDTRYIFVTGATDYQAAWSVAFTTDGVALTAERNPASSRDYPVYALLLKGVVNSYDGTFYANMPTGGPPNSETVNCGFRPGLIIATHIGFEDPDDMEQPANQGCFGIGFASELAQKSMCFFAQTNVANMPITVGRSDQLGCLYSPFQSTIIWTANCDNYTDTGFDLTVDPIGANVNDYMFYLALDFGPGITAQILDDVSIAAQEVSLEFDRGSVILGTIVDAINTQPNDPPQSNLCAAVNHWIAYPGREASVGFSNEAGVTVQNTKTARWSTELRGLGYNGLESWTGTSDFSTLPTMGFTRSDLSDVYFLGVAFGTAPTGFNKLWMGDIKPNMYFGDDQVDRVYMGDELVWVPD